MALKESPFLGRYKIISMAMWDQDFVDAEVPGFIEFKKNGLGEFHFGYVASMIFGTGLSLLKPLWPE